MRAPTRTTTVDMLSAEELQEEAARLLKHMSIGACACRSLLWCCFLWRVQSSVQHGGPGLLASPPGTVLGFEHGAGERPRAGHTPAPPPARTRLPCLCHACADPARLPPLLPFPLQMRWTPWLP